MTTGAHLRVAVVFDTPYPRWTSERHHQQKADEVAGKFEYEPELEYQVAAALEENGHEVHLVGVQDDPHEILAPLTEWKPDLVMNVAESFRSEERHDFVFPALLEATGYRYTGSPALGLLVSRDKAMSKKILAYHGIRVPGFATWRPNEKVKMPDDLGFPLIVKPLAADASAGIAQASVHRIRIAVMNAVDNYSFPNSNTGEHEAHVTRTVVGKMAIHHDPEHASHVVLPVMPR